MCDAVRIDAKGNKDKWFAKELMEVNYSYISFFPIILGQKLPEKGIG